MANAAVDGLFATAFAGSDNRRDCRVVAFAQGKTFTPEQAKAILEMAQDPWRVMFAIAAYAGLRAGEILGLSVEDVDLARGVLNIRKTAWYGQIQTTKSWKARTPFR